MNNKWSNSSNFRGNTKNDLEKTKSLSSREVEDLEEKGYTLIQPRKGSELHEAIEKSKDRIEVYIVLKDGKKIVLGHRYPIYLFQGGKSEVSKSLVTLRNGKKYFKKNPAHVIDNSGEPDVVTALNEYLRVLNQTSNSRVKMQFVTSGVKGGITITSPKDIARFEVEAGRTVYTVLNSGAKYQLAKSPSTGFTTMRFEKVKEQFRLYSVTGKDKDYPDIEVYVNNWHSESTVQNLNGYLRQSHTYSTVVANVLEGTKVKMLVFPISYVKGFVLE